MIRPEGFRGAAFGDAADGDARTDESARTAIAAELGISTEWALISQVHGAGVVGATDPGHLGEGDALYSEVPGLPMMVATADCLPIIVEGESVAGVIHAGWRGLQAGVIEAALDAVAHSGHTVVRAAIGPAIGPCCYEVGEDVAGRFAGFVATSTAGHVSVDLPGAAADRLGDLVEYRSEACTRCGAGYNSHRRDATLDRQVAVAWLPTG